MKKLLTSAALVLMFCGANTAFAADDPVPAGDPQYKQCLAFAKKLGWEGGEEKSPVKGQTKLQAFCTCMWNETPEDFKGNLATFSESKRGAATSKICEKHSNWYSE
jgi:hypothetical protein